MKEPDGAARGAPRRPINGLTAPGYGRRDTPEGLGAARVVLAGDVLWGTGDMHQYFLSIGM